MRVVRELLKGAALVPKGFALWRHRPGLMALGMLPAAIAAVLIGAALITLGLFVESIAEALTPFAREWGETERGITRTLIAIALLTGGIVAAVYSFTALTLLIGDPFYERIWRGAEQHFGDFTPRPVRLLRSVGDGVRLVLRAIGYALVTAAVGLIPVIGQVTSAVLGPVLAGHLLARELTVRPFEARGIDASRRAAVLRGSRARELGFGIAVQLCFLVPGGAIVIMPAAVVGATQLARTVLPDDDASAAQLAQ